MKQLRWLDARKAELLPVQYFHVVFTIPQLLHPVFLANQAAAYKLLFAAVSETLQEVACNPRRLGARIGFTAVLHTWTQTLLYHPHIHCIVPGGGLGPDRARWIRCRPGFFLPVRVLSTVFRGKLLSKIEKAFAAGQLATPELSIANVLPAAAGRAWVVYSKQPFAGPKQVLKYLAAYTHRIAISNRRILALAHERVTFSWKDRRRANRRRRMTVSAFEFLRRFAMHILPPHFVRIRHFGLLSNAKRKASLQRCRELLNAPEPEQPTYADTAALLEHVGIDLASCPRCGTGHLREIDTLHAMTDQLGHAQFF